LWTLQYEFACYLGVAAIGVIGVLRRRRLVAAGAGGLWLIMIGRHVVAADVATRLRLSSLLVPLALSFALGMLLFLYRDRVVISNRWAAVAATSVLLSLPLGLYDVVGVAAWAYLCLFLAIRLPLVRFGRRVDLSYGVYIYAFPVQQILTLYGFSRYGLFPYIAVTTCIASTLAVISWFCIERPSLRLKNVSPGRRKASRASSG
jgi:peptidoglycan/LPS O-acetylase OafA/YrhL